MHIDDIGDNEHKDIIQDTTKTTANSTHSNSNDNSNVNNISKQINAYDNRARHPNIYNIYEFYQRYESMGMRYNCIDTNVYSFECIIRRRDLLDGNAYDIVQFLKHVQFLSPKLYLSVRM